MKEASRKLELKIYRRILEFPERIDLMETRSEEACRRLAREIARIVEAESDAPQDPR